MLGSSLGRCLLGFGLALCLLSTALPLAEAQQHEASKAEIKGYGAGSVQAGNQNAQTPAPIPATVVSTGSIQVTVELVCIKWYKVELLKTGPIGAGYVGGFGEISTGCMTKTVTKSIYVGLDGGDYQLRLTARGCDDVLHVQTIRLIIVDPPLPWVFVRFA